MNEKNNLINFLNSMKETLPFKDEDDFKRKITENKEFRIKVQKLVYLSKFFGWNNHYHFNFHEHGPYSCQLSEDYNSISSFNTPSNDLNMNHGELKEFVENQDTEFLESTSTILYYLDKRNLKNIDETQLTTILSYLKPHISKNILEKSFEMINKHGLLNHSALNQSDLNKKIVLDKLDGLINIFENFEICSNKILLQGSLDYSRLALKRESLTKPHETELLKFIYNYGDYLESFYFKNYKMLDNFPYYDLTEIYEEFDKLQDYVSNLKILPRLDDDVDLGIFLE